MVRPFTLADAPDLHRLLSGEDVLRFFPNPNPPTPTSVEQLIIGQLMHWDEHGYGWWAVTVCEILAGWCGLNYLPETEETEVAYLLGRQFWGQWYATEAARRSLAFGFSALSVGIIVGIIHHENLASQRVLEKLRMSFTNDANYFGMAVRRYAIAQRKYEQGKVA